MFFYSTNNELSVNGRRYVIWRKSTKLDKATSQIMLIEYLYKAYIFTIMLEEKY